MGGLHRLDERLFHRRRRRWTFGDPERQAWWSGLTDDERSAYVDAAVFRTDPQLDDARMMLAVLEREDRSDVASRRRLLVAGTVASIAVLVASLFYGDWSTALIVAVAWPTSAVPMWNQSETFQERRQELRRIIEHRERVDASADRMVDQCGDVLDRLGSV